MSSRRRKGNKKDGGDEKHRIAIVNSDKCKPRKCALECKTYCPVNRMGKKCIDVGKEE